MGDINPINKPLVRDLQQMGILSADASVPRFIASLRCKTEAFIGGSNTTTKVLAQTPISFLSVTTFKTDGSAALGLTNVVPLVQNTHFSLSGSTITYIGNTASTKLVLMNYLY